jgi:hypothetical protein
MHRSGTSMVARLLMQSGLDLGPEDQFPVPRHDNPEGYWESIPFQSTNQRLLAIYDTAWQIPPEFADGWESDDRLADLRMRAKAIPAELGLKEPWGWKDPRNSITLPFWKSIWPDLRVVMCVRNPLDVAISLMTRDRMTITAALRLWATYQRRILDAVPPAQRVVTHYDSFFADPRAELRRLLEFLGITAPEQTVVQACESIVSGLRHSRSGLGDLEQVCPPAQVLELYRDLCAASGPNLAYADRASGNAPAVLTNAVVTAMRLEAQVEEHAILFQSLMKECRLLEGLAVEQTWSKVELVHQLDSARQIAEDRMRQIRNFEDRLSARRHRYADKIASVLKKILSPAFRARRLLNQPAA